MDICRSCESKEIYANLIETSNSIILNKLKAIADIQFHPNDCLPKHICKNCLSNLEIAYKFKIQCEYTEQKLRRLLQAGDGNKIRNNVKLKRERSAQNVAIIVQIKEDPEKVLSNNTENCIEIKEEAEAEEDINTDRSNDEQNLFENDITSNKSFKFESIEVLDDIPRKPISNTTNPIEIVHKFEEQIIETQEEICQDTNEHSSASQNEKLNRKTILKTKHFTCATCNEIFYIYKKFVEHKKSHGKQRFQCPDCGKWFPRRYNMNNHRTVHQNERNFPCNLCERCYVNQSSLDRHIREFHNLERKYICDICDKRFGQASSLKSHLLTHSIDRPFNCDMCGKWFKSQYLLDSHKKSHSPLPRKRLPQKKTKKNIRRRKPADGNIFVCEFCGKLSTPFATHKLHLRTHTGEKPYECFVCKKRFANAQVLRNHMRVHTGERPYKCDVCHLTYAQSNHLISHKLVHSGAKPHKCLICMKSFAHRPTLTVHMRIHTGETPYHCTQCPKKFIDLNGLKRHKLIHTKSGAEQKDSISVANENE